jgi:hypothetical protein
MKALLNFILEFMGKNKNKKNRKGATIKPQARSLSSSDEAPSETNP